MALVGDQGAGSQLVRPCPHGRGGGGVRHSTAFPPPESQLQQHGGGGEEERRQSKAGILGAIRLLGKGSRPFWCVSPWHEKAVGIEAPTGSRTWYASLGSTAGRRSGPGRRKKAKVHGMDPTCVLDTYRSKFGDLNLRMLSQSLVLIWWPNKQRDS